MEPTALIYSSHDRGDYLHRKWIVERALENPINKTVLYLPFSSGEKDQEYSWGTFRWYFDKFKSEGLVAKTCFWKPNMSRDEAAEVLQLVRDSEVVILGGGSTFAGFDRYDGLGTSFDDDYTHFRAILYERQAAGKLTVGFSAGAMQLADFCPSDDFHKPYSLIHNVTVTLHHEWSREGELAHIGRSYPNHFAFGLPNDAGIASAFGYLPSGNKWQILRFIIDSSWDRAEDAFHMKTRMGMGIDHFYLDGRKWTFYEGDRMIQIFSPDYAYRGAWILPANQATFFDYWTQQPTIFTSVEHIFAVH